MSIQGVSGLKPIISMFKENNIADNIKNKETISFLDYLNNATKDTNSLILESEKLSEDFAIGKTDNIHQVLIAIEKADVALQFTMQVRNKILDAYSEIMRMQI